MTSPADPRPRPATPDPLQRADALLRKGKAASAAKVLGQAFDRDPALRDSPDARALAAKITRQSADTAVRTLADPDQRDAFIVRTGRKGVKPAQGRLTNGLIVVFSLLLVGVIAVLLLITVRGGFFGVGGSPFGTAAQVERRIPAGRSDIEYYLVIPGGAPPEDGWPTLVAIHGAGQTGLDVAQRFAELAARSGVLVIAPTLPDLQERAYASDGGDFYIPARGIVLVVLEDMFQVTATRPGAQMHMLGAVYFGYGAGARFVSWIAANGLDYADAGFALELPLGVSLASARPSLIPPGPALPHLVTVGADDPNLRVSTDYAANLQLSGYPVQSEVIPNTGTDLSARQIELTVQWTRQQFGG